MSNKLQRAQAVVSEHMDAILCCFMPGAKITVLVRQPRGEREPGAHDFMMTDDDLAKVAKMIDRRMTANRQRRTAHFSLQVPSEEKP